MSNASTLLQNNRTTANAAPAASAACSEQTADAVGEQPLYITRIMAVFGDAMRPVFVVRSSAMKQRIVDAIYIWTRHAVIAHRAKRALPMPDAATARLMDERNRHAVCKCNRVHAPGRLL
jgi:hypothetical protein